MRHKGTQACPPPPDTEPVLSLLNSLPLVLSLQDPHTAEAFTIATRPADAPTAPSTNYHSLIEGS